jgi:peptidoglycan L-alanyl-D-glutamate endopeptidase CwlK
LEGGKRKMSTLFNSPLQDDKNFARVKLLHPKLAHLCWEHLSLCFLTGIYLRVTQTLRTFEEQQALYDLGRTKPGKKVTNARAGLSWHNYGLAYDVVILEKDGKVNWNTLDPKWKRVGFEGEKLGLTWGGSFKSFIDYPHFEYHPNLTRASVALTLWNKKGMEGVYEKAFS